MVYLDDDAIPAPDWLGLLLASFADEKQEVRTGRVITPESSNKDQYQEVPRCLSNQEPRWFEMATFGGMGLGSNMALRKRACTSPKFFDERLGRGAPFQIGEENYAFARLLADGYRVIYLPSAVVFHPPLSRDTIENEARNSISYWLLLFSKFPDGEIKSRAGSFFGGFGAKPLDWPRDSQEPGEIVTSGWRVLVEGLY